jgi:transposase
VFFSTKASLFIHFQGVIFSWEKYYFWRKCHYRFKTSIFEAKDWLSIKPKTIFYAERRCYMGRMMITSKQWQRIETVFRLMDRMNEREKRRPGKVSSVDSGGRPKSNDKLILEGVLWVLLNRKPWRDLPKRYPSAATCTRYLKKWRSTLYEKICITPQEKTHYAGQSVWNVIWIHFIGNLSKAKKKLWYSELYRMTRNIHGRSNRFG